MDRCEEHTAWLHAITCALDGRTFATASSDQTILLWDAGTWEVLARLRGHRGEIKSLAFSADGRMLASGAWDDGTTRLWDISKGSLSTLLGHVQPVTGVAFSPDGKTLATSSDDCKVKLWNPATKQEVAALQLPGGCRSVRFSRDGRFLAVGYLLLPHQFIRLWEVPSFEEIAAAEASGKARITPP